MNKADLIDRLDRILSGGKAGYDDDDQWHQEPIGGQELLDELDREGLEIVKK